MSVGSLCGFSPKFLEGADVEAVPAVQLTRPIGGDIADDQAAPAKATEDDPSAEEEAEADDDIRVPRAKLTRKIEGVEKPRAAQARAVPAEPMILDIDPLNNVPARLRKYMPALEQCLTLEIHFLRKVCNPTDEQLKPIRTAGTKRIFRLAEEFAKNENGAFRNQKEGARDLLRKELLTAAKDVLNEEDLKTYTRELELREQARFRGIAELMTLHADSDLSFNAEQFGRVSEAIQKKPNPQWSQGMQSLFYKEYSPKPGFQTISDVLNEKQKQLMRSQFQRNSTIWFGWPRNIGIQQFGSDFNLDELSTYDQREEQP
ncbi:MAG: hypothetical protein HUJ26_07305 [Planctomycetaceae bacterium]|nr:hypothetical protein [Planctomycetaceae bacterium]